MRAPIEPRVLLATAIIALSLSAGHQLNAEPTSQTQYVYTGECNGMPHWVSMRYDRQSNKISNLIVLAKCPEGGEPTSRIFRQIEIPVNAGGMFGDVIKQAGIDYLIEGRIVSRSKAVVNHRGPPKVLSCAGSGSMQVPMCSRFDLTANEQ